MVFVSLENTSVLFDSHSKTNSSAGLVSHFLTDIFQLTAWTPVTYNLFFWNKRTNNLPNGQASCFKSYVQLSFEADCSLQVNGMNGKGRWKSSVVGLFSSTGAEVCTSADCR